MRNGLQSLSLLLFALVQPIAGRLAQLTDKGISIEERSDTARGPVTPAKGAFAIWGPLFAGNLVLAARSFFRRRFEAPANKWIAWLSGTTFAGNIAWSLQAQFAGLGWPSFGIISSTAAAACATTIVAESAAEHSDFARIAANTTGPLAGWLTIATFANLESTLNETHGQVSDCASSRRAVALISAAGVAATGMAIATRGSLAYGGAAAWGLSGILLRNQREDRPAVAATAAIGLGAVTLATLLSRHYLRR